ncbi:hypothetical protein ACP70R_009098 [Stipagrostis hirtigluma subsp. patula]
MAPALPAKRRRAPSPAPPPPPSPPHKRSKAPSPERKGRKTAPSPVEAVEPAPQKPLLFQRTWPPKDEVRILEAVATHRRDHGELPAPAALFAALDGLLQNKRAGKREVAEKLRSLKRRYDRDSKKEAPPADKHERRLYRLSRKICGKTPAAQDKSAGERTGKDGAQAKSAGERTGNGAAQAKSVAGELTGNAAAQAKIAAGERTGNDAAQANSAGERTGNDASQAKSAGERAGNDAAQANSAGERTGKDAQASKSRTLGEMCELYPYLVHEAMVLFDPEVLETLLPSIDDNEAEALNSKIKKLRGQLTKAITESARMKKMEIPAMCLCPSSRLQPEILRVGNENNILFEHLNKTDDGACDQERLARVERDIVELRNMLRASQCQANRESNWHQEISSAQGIRCDYAESGLKSIVADNQIPRNMQRKKIEAPNSLLHEENEEVTSKYRCAIPRNVRHDTLKLPGVIMPPFNTFCGRRRKIDTESCNVGGKEVVLLSIVRPRVPVANAILQSSSQSSVVGGMQLGTQFCKVFVKAVLKREALLSRPYENMITISDALKRYIAWPREQVISEITPIPSMAAPNQQPPRPDKPFEQC